MKARIGTVVWAELQTTHVDEVKDLWSDLFHYQWQSEPLQDKIQYSIASFNKHKMGGIVDLPPALRKKGAGAFHLYFIAVENLDESKKRALSLGGKVVVEEISLSAIGRWSIFTDPLGGVFCMVEMKGEPIPYNTYKQGAYWWHELICKDPAKSAFFYSRLFDWKVTEQKMSPTETHYLAEDKKGELVRMSFRPMDTTLKEAGIPDFWLGFLLVKDIDEACKTAIKHGSTPLLETPKDVEGRYAWLALPDKSLIGFMQIS